MTTSPADAPSALHKRQPLCSVVQIATRLIGACLDVAPRAKTASEIIVKVLVTFAVEAEFSPWRRLRNMREIKIGEIAAYQAQIGRAQVDFVITGMGMENARRASEALLHEPYQFCVTAGFAGALVEKHAIGDILVAESVQELGKSKTLQCSRNLVYAASDDGAKLVKTFLTANQVISTAAEKKRLAPFAEAVEMESFAILTAAHHRKKAVVAIRVISDSMLRDIPAQVSTMVDGKGQVKIGGVVRYLARHPLQLPALLRLSRDSRTAAEALAHFLEAFIKKLSFSSHGWPPTELQEVAAR
jgi:adenosylhomocysteine nucleosidase